MAATAESDPLLHLRIATTNDLHPILSSSEDPSSAKDVVQHIKDASFLHFDSPVGQRTISLSEQTRFVLDDQPIDLRSIYVAWLNRDANAADYRSAVTFLNESLTTAGSAHQIHMLPVSARLDLISWFKAAQEESEYIQPLDAKVASAQAADSAAVAAGAHGGIATIATATSQLVRGKTVDARLVEIYQGERRLPSGNRNGVLRGIKPTDFSHVRKITETFIGRSRNKPGSNNPSIPASISNNPALVQRSSKPAANARRLEPIILLSPSASSLLRINNIRPFLQDGIFIPASDPSVSGTSTNNILHITRTMPSIEPRYPLRFVLVDSPDQFKPDYWSRVVAVFTTGQQWQFRSYKWTKPEELFKHTLGLYVGWNGEQLPDAVKGWGRSVSVSLVDKWVASQSDGKGRWRDREVVELIWSQIEGHMKGKGWTGGGPGGAGGR